MSKVKWTDEQQKAIDAYGNTLVSAGAGSGKTAVLTERIVNMLETRKDLNINNILVLTFTNAAAFNMKNRVYQKLLAKNDQENLNLLDGAFITTFDAFALAVVERYHQLIGIKPSVNIMSTEFFNYLIRKTLDEIFDEYYENDNDNFKELIKDHVLDNDHFLKESILKIYTKIILLKDEEKYLNNYFNINNNNELIDKYLIIYKKEIIKYLIELKNNYEKAIDLTIDDKFKNNLTIVNKEIDNYLNLLETSITNIDVKEKLSVRKSTKKSDDESINNELNDVWDKVTKIKKDLTSIVNLDNDRKQLNKQLDSIKNKQEIIIEILLKLKHKTEEFMFKNNTFSFDSIAKMGIKLLEENDEIVAILKEEFKEIMVDEYQDTSDLQEEFINLIADNNVYVVGDIKQSIYRFRNANPKLFKDKYDKYRFKKGGDVIDLTRNFRSRAEVVDGINAIFNDLMSDDEGGADYINDHQMVYGNKKYDDYKQEHFSNVMDVLTYKEEENKRFVEANIIADDINNKLENNYQVMDECVQDDGTNKTVLRNAKYSDFAIITGDSKYHSKIKQALTNASIPSVIIGDVKINENKVFLVLNSILNAIYLMDKKSRELPYYLTSIARSFVYKMYDDDITELIISKKYYSFPFVDILNKLNKEKDKLNVYELVEAIIKEFSIYEKIEIIKDQAEAFEVLNKIKVLALEFSDYNLNLLSFIDFLSLVYDGAITISTNLNSDVNNAVTIINIHKSKGLEYNICYYPLLYKKFNKQDERISFGFDKELGIIIPNIQNNIIYDVFTKKMYVDKVKSEDLSEKIRLFYVALTRAKDKITLILKNQDPIPAFGVSFKSFLDHRYSGKNSKLIENVEYEALKRKNSEFLNLIKNTSDYYTFKENNIQSKKINTKHISKTSKDILSVDQKQAMETGTKMHEIMEFVDLKNPKVDLIKDEHLKEKILAFINSGLDFKNANIYTEYEFYTSDSNGIIDLMLEYDDEIKIIDYKYSNIDDPAYIRQLNMYKDYIKTISDKKISMYLYSIIKEELKEVKDYDL